MLAETDRELLSKVRLGERVVPAALWGLGLPRLVASNNWCVAASKSASGAAILANDPHLEVNRLPAMWSELVLSAPGISCVCATIPGIPAPLVARTPHLAWGATYTFMDGVDSWVED